MLRESLRAWAANEERKIDGGQQGATASLQAALMRFEGRFTARLVAAFAPLLESEDPKVRLRAAEDELRLLSSGLDIAASAHPEANLVDMLALVALGRDAMLECWDEATFGEDGRAIRRAFDSSWEDISSMARHMASADVETEVERLIDEWRAQNPGRVQIEGVRLSTYVVERAGTLGTRAPRVLRLMRQATHAADDAVLLGERALYAAQRLPFLLRKHARVGSTELFVDLTRNLESLEALTPENAGFVLAALDKLHGLATSANKPLRSVAGMVQSDSLRPLAIESGVLVDKLAALVHELTVAHDAGLGRDASEQLRSLGGRFEQALGRVLFKSFLSVSGIAAVTAGAWFVVRLARAR